eukprot:COSAG06_NODE_34045_length_480_cov_1.496063_1_plen_22_part_01
MRARVAAVYRFLGLLLALLSYS